MKLTTTEEGVFLDEIRIPRCTSVDVQDISPTGLIEVVLHIEVNAVDIQYRTKE